jgi:hypothetical protein
MTGGGALATAFLVGAVIGVFVLIETVRLDSLATPTPFCEGEIAVVSALFVAYVVVTVTRRVKSTREGGKPSASMRPRLKVEFPGPVRALALALFIFGFFFFAFWAAADVLGGYNGYSYSFSLYPTLRLIYDNTIGLMPYVSSRDQGTQASFYLGLATLGLVLFRLNRGIRTALRDAISLFLAPCAVVFELALWSHAPEDMTWHVTDFLWIGGIDDGGIRQRDFVRLPFVNYPPVVGGHFVGTYASGPYVFSNWFVLAVALLLVASRVPWSSLVSTAFRRPMRARLQEGGSVPVSRSTVQAKGGGPAGRTISAFWALLSRRHSGFCGLNRLDESTKADHYSRKLYQASRIEIL